MTIKALPIDNIKADFFNAIAKYSTLLLSAPPGAGKSTCLPLWLLEMDCFAGKKIYLLQPRRIAAKNIACYLAQQLGEKVGHTIGYRLRNEAKVSKHTRLEVITEGILTRIIQDDAELVNCGLVVFDEFHERSLNADLAFALTRDIQQGLRDDLKILLMSATLASDEIKAQLPDAQSLVSEGRSFPVEVSYQAVSNLRNWREQALHVISSSLKTYDGSILVFLPRSSDIRYLTQQLTHLLPSNTLLCPLYGDLSLVQQQQAIAAPEVGMRKVVLATNIAETSLTIEGVTLVIDSGFENVAVYDPQTLSNKLSLRAIAKSSAIQRAGRAGRLTAGHCIRLYSEDDFQRRPEQSVSEIQQADLLPMLMNIAQWGVSECQQLPMIELPSARHEQLAWQELTQLNLVTKQRQLTNQGKLVANFPAHPRIANMLVAANALALKLNAPHLLALASVLSAIIEERDIFSAEQRRDDANINHRIILLMRQAKNHRHQRILQQAKKLFSIANQHCVEHSLSCFTSQVDELPFTYTGLLLAHAYPERIAKKRDTHGQYLTAFGKGVQLQENDVLANEQYIVAAQLFQHQQSLNVALAADIDLNVAIELTIVLPDSRTKLLFDEQQGKIKLIEQHCLGAIIIDEKSVKQRIASEPLIDCWQQQIAKNGLDWLNMNENTLLLLERWRWLNHTQQQLNFPDVSPDILVMNIAQWLGPYLNNIISKRQLERLNFHSILMNLLTYEQQQQLEEIAPSTFVGPTGRKCPIRYSLSQPPIVSLPMQELYGLSATPKVGDIQSNNGHNLTLEILSPAQRPIQITQHLAEFWQGSYREVQKDMKARYPKHYWPDDPANAQATRKTKRHIVEN